MSQSPFFHQPSGTVRFWITVDGQPFGASVGKEALHYRFQTNAMDEDPLATYTAHASLIEAAVMRRIANGSREPVMLRELDLRTP